MKKYFGLILVLFLLMIIGCSEQPVAQVRQEIPAVTDEVPAAADESETPTMHVIEVEQDTTAHEKMSFFITSTGPGDGANLGGLDGADAHCKDLASAVGAGDKKWRAYLSTSEQDARDRIGQGPWFNSNGVQIATNIENLHASNNLNKETALNEKGEQVSGRGDSVNRHDILTGSKSDGTFYSGSDDSTCNKWRSDSIGSARLGHHDRTGGGDDPTSWNSAHGSRGCSQENLESTGGDGLFYCFESNDMQKVKTFKLEGGNFYFEQDGNRGPEIRVAQGQTVRIEFSSIEGFHDWSIDEFNAATDRVRPNDGETFVEFVADKKGEFEYFCSVGSHRQQGMFGSFIVE